MREIRATTAVLGSIPLCSKRSTGSRVLQVSFVSAPVEGSLCLLGVQAAHHTCGVARLHS